MQRFYLLCKSRNMRTAPTKHHLTHKPWTPFTPPPRILSIQPLHTHPHAIALVCLPLSPGLAISCRVGQPHVSHIFQTAVKSQAFPSLVPLLNLSSPLSLIFSHSFPLFLIIRLQNSIKGNQSIYLKPACSDVSHWRPNKHIRLIGWCCCWISDNMKPTADFWKIHRMSRRLGD